VGVPPSLDGFEPWHGGWACASRCVLTSICRCVWSWPTLAADAASISQLRGGRPCALRWPRGHTHTRWAWRPSVSRRRLCSLSRPVAQERRCLHATPPSSARRAGSHPGCRAPVQRAVALALRWTLRRHPGWLPALRAGSGGPHAWRLRSRLKSCGWGRTSAWTAPRPARLPRPCGGHAGAWRTSGSASAPAGPARCPAAAAPTHPPALPRKGASRPLPSPGPATSSACPAERRASGVAPPRQGRALRVAWWPRAIA
jgi:hypothetical protein